MNHALVILLLSVIVYGLADHVLGTGLTRDVVTVLAIMFSLLNFMRYLPHAWHAFRRGGMRDNWQLLMGNVLFWAGFAAREMWLWSMRSDRVTPAWMEESFLNGFFVFWVLGAGILCYTAGGRYNRLLPPHRIYYIAMGVVSGVLLGLLLARSLPS